MGSCIAFRLEPGCNEDPTFFFLTDCYLPYVTKEKIPEQQQRLGAIGAITTSPDINQDKILDIGYWLVHHVHTSHTFPTPHPCLQVSCDVHHRPLPKTQQPINKHMGALVNKGPCAASLDRSAGIFPC